VSDRRMDDADLARMLREGLAARDREVRVPSFRALSSRESRPALPLWRKAVAASVAAVIVAALLPFWIVGRPDRGGQDAALPVDTALAHELSSRDFWRVPSDELLAFSAPPLSAPFPEPYDYEISLEESLL
jgi:hypothetical protein